MFKHVFILWQINIFCTEKGLFFLSRLHLTNPLQVTNVNTSLFIGLFMSRLMHFPLLWLIDALRLSDVVGTPLRFCKRSTCYATLNKNTVCKHSFPHNTINLYFFEICKECLFLYHYRLYIFWKNKSSFRYTAFYTNKFGLHRRLVIEEYIYCPRTVQIFIVLGTKSIVYYQQTL